MKKILVVGLALSSFVTLPMQQIAKSTEAAETAKEEEAQIHERLFLALKSGSVEPAKALIKQCPNLSIRNEQRETLLISLVKAMPGDKPCSCRNPGPCRNPVPDPVPCLPTTPSKKELAPYFGILEVILSERRRRREEPKLKKEIEEVLAIAPTNMTYRVKEFLTSIYESTEDQTN